MTLRTPDLAPSSDPDLDPDRDRDEIRVDPWEWPRFDAYGVPQRRRQRMGAAVFLIWLVPTAVQAVGQGRPVAAVAPLAVAYGGGYLALWWVGPRASPVRRVTLLAALFGLGIGYVAVIYPTGSLSLLGYALSGSIVLLPLGWAKWIGSTCIVGAAVASRLLTGQVDWDSTLTLALIAVIVLGVNRMARLVDKLHGARAEVRALAVAGERARLARDLHDILGHSLTTITVKTALTRRLLESGAAERALAEVRDSEELARQALADIRATVSGQRRMSLAAELVSARAALTAAGIEADLPGAVDNVVPQLVEPLAYVLREGVTNVIRHSGARRCTVRLGPRWVEVTDDGTGGASAAGNGLTGLAERLAAAGGSLQAGPLPEGGYRLRAEVPE